MGAWQTDVECPWGCGERAVLRWERYPDDGRMWAAARISGSMHVCEEKEQP